MKWWLWAMWAVGVLALGGVLIWIGVFMIGVCLLLSGGSADEPWK